MASAPGGTGADLGILDPALLKKMGREWARDEDREAWCRATRQAISACRTLVIQRRKAGRIEEARQYAEDWRALIGALAAFTGKRYPIPSVAKCLRQG